MSYSLNNKDDGFSYYRYQFTSEDRLTFDKIKALIKEFEKMGYHIKNIIYEYEEENPYSHDGSSLVSVHEKDFNNFDKSNQLERINSVNCSFDRLGYIVYLYVTVNRKSFEITVPKQKEIIDHFESKMTR